MPCPHYESTDARERPQKTALGYRTFRCAGCGWTFNERTGTAFNYLEYRTDIVLLVVLWRLRYKLSLRDLTEMFLGASSSPMRRCVRGGHPPHQSLSQQPA